MADDPQQVEADLKRAMRLDPQWRYGMALAKHYEKIGRKDDACGLAGQLHKQFPENFTVGSLYAKLLLESRKYEACGELLRSIHFLPSEGAMDVLKVYKECHLMLAVEQMQRNNHAEAARLVGLARQWPTRLNVGQPRDSELDDRLENFLAAVCCEKLGQQAEAARLFEAVVRKKDIVGYAPYPPSPVNTLTTALAIRRQGKPADAQRVLDDWLNKEPRSRLAQWCLAAYAGKVDEQPTGRIREDMHFRVLRAFLIQSP